MLDTFERYALAAGAQLSVAADEVAAAKAIAGNTSGAIICTAAVRDLYPDLCRSLQEAGRRVEVAEEITVPRASPGFPQRSGTEGAEATPGSQALAAALAGATGIVLARAGVAETGSLVLADDALAPRLLSMLADVCVALLSAPAILPGLDEAGALLAELNSEGHRYVSLVTGPSRTADIERVLTIGVQGPKALHIIVLAKEAP